MRVSYLGPWNDNNGIGMAAWDETKYGDGSGQFPGIVWNAKDSSVPLSGVDSSWTFVTPRVGFAWDLKGTGETVLRGGVGMYRYHEPQLIWSNLLEVGAGARTYDAPGGLTLAQIDALAGSGNLVFGGQAIDINDSGQPLAYNWSLTLNQKLPWSTNIEVGYVGNKQDNIVNTDIANLNAVPLYSMLDNPTGNENLYRPLQAYGDLSGLPPQHVLELPRPADPPEPAAWELQLHGGLHVLEDPRDPGGLHRHAAVGHALRVPAPRPGTTSTASWARTAPTWRRCRSAGCSRSSRTTRPSISSWAAGSSPASRPT